MTTPTEAMRQALDALTLTREQLAGDRLELIACHAWPAGSGAIPEHDRAGTQALREYDECISSTDAAITALRDALSAAPRPPAAQQPVTQGELPDDIRVPLHKLWADAGYLVGRACDGERDMAVHRIKALCDEVERAVRTALAAAHQRAWKVRYADALDALAADRDRLHAAFAAGVASGDIAQNYAWFAREVLPAALPAPPDLDCVLTPLADALGVPARLPKFAPV